MPRITISAPVQGRWMCELNVPHEALDDLADFLSRYENDDYIQTILEDGWMANEQLDLMDVTVED